MNDKRTGIIQAEQSVTGTRSEKSVPPRESIGRFQRGRTPQRGRPTDSSTDRTLIPPKAPFGKEPDEGLWFGIVWPPSYGGVFLAVTFAGQADGPAWEVWTARAIVALFWWSVGWWWSASCFRELRRRGKWVPPGATWRPCLAAAGYIAVMLLLATAVIVGMVTCVGIVSGAK